ncbi:WD40 repeat domain-containing protein [Chloroflexota bacterium]|nr:WD40 repeat domain-containing protein [Chloroflexota bacterium]
MKIKLHSLLVFLFGCLFLLTSCRPQVSEVEDAAEAITSQLMAIKDGDPFILNADQFSPNGEWFVVQTQISDDSEDPWAFVGYSLINPDLILYQDEEVGIVYGAEWAADSTAFISDGYDQPGYCPNKNKVVIYKIDPENEVLTTNAFQFEHSGCTQKSWSPDETQIAVHVDPDTIYILDRSGELQNELTYALPDGYSSQMFWGDRGLYFIHKKGAITKVNLVNLEDGSTNNILKTPNRLVLVGFSNEYDLMVMQDGLNSTLWLYDLEDMSVIGSFDFPSEALNVYFSSNPREIGISAVGKEGSDLFVLDYRRGSLSNFGSIKRISGWNIVYQGYLMLGGGHSDYKLCGPIESSYRTR